MDILQHVRDTAEAAHQCIGQIGFDPALLKSQFHAAEPGIAGLGVNGEVGMHLADIGVAVVFEIEPWAAKKSGHEFELRDPGMSQTVAAQVHEPEQFSHGFSFNQIIKAFDELANTGSASEALIGGLLVCPDIDHCATMPAPAAG